MLNGFAGGLTAASLLDQIDLTQKMSNFAIICMVISLIVVIGVPIYVFVYLKKRLNFAALSLFNGVLFYFLCVVFLNNITVNLLLAIPNVGDFLTTNRALGVSIISFIGVIFEVVGLFFGVSFLAKRFPRFGDNTMFGLGFSTIEAIMSAASVLFGFITLSMTINSTGLEEIFKVYPEEELANAITSMQSLLDIPSAQFLTYGINCTLLLAFRMCASMLLFGMVTNKMPKYMLAVVFGFKLIFVVPDILVNSGVYQNIWISVIVYVIITALFVVFTLKQMQQFMPEDLNELKKKIDKNPPQQKIPKIVMPK